MAQEQLFASFVLDKSKELEIALHAENVTEATVVTGKIQQLPGSLDFVEGVMALRDDVIPIINLKTRFGWTENGYDDDAKVAVVKIFHRRYGLLFDDIKEVFAAEGGDVQKVDGALQTDDKIISAIIQREDGQRAIELLELGNLFAGKRLELEKAENISADAIEQRDVTKYSSYVVFRFAEQLYGVPVECAQEITFFDLIEQMHRGGVEEPEVSYDSSIEGIFKHGDIDGTLKLRGKLIPVLSARRVIYGEEIPDDEYLGEQTRVLVLSDNGCRVGVVVEEIMAIETIYADDVLPMGKSESRSVKGIFQRQDGKNIMLLDMEQLICGRMDELKALARLSDEDSQIEENEPEGLDISHHLITENCYLVFSVGRNMAVQLKDVQEIIDKTGVMGVPGEVGFSTGVINLRGSVVPVINLRTFLGYEPGVCGAEQKLVICRVGQNIVALQVDSILTIYKQEQYQSSGTLNPEFKKIEDTLDRLIVFDGGAVQKEHVLVINVHNLIRNHLELGLPS